MPTCSSHEDDVDSLSRYAALSTPSAKMPKLDSEQDCTPDDQVVPSSPKGPGLNGSEVSQPLLPLGDTAIVNPKQGVLPHISSRELYSHLMSLSDQVLVLDCRTRASYNASHPDGKKFPQWISVPEETVRNGYAVEISCVCVCARFELRVPLTVANKPLYSSTTAPLYSPVNNLCVCTLSKWTHDRTIQ